MNILAKPFTWILRRNNQVEIMASLLVILFIYTGLNKMLDYETFKFQLGRSPFVQNMNGFIAATLPIGELLIALALIIKRTRLIGFYASFFLMVLFTGYIYAMLHYSYYVPCSCGGVLAALSWEQHLVFNCFFIAIALAGILLQAGINQRLRSVPRKTIHA